jgi:hypothetical protein
VIGLVIVHAFTVAYDLRGLWLLSIGFVMIFIVYMLGDIAEAKLIEHFNQDEDEA